MTRKRLEKLKRELDALRRSQTKARDLESLATRLGRRQINRGKEPMWESIKFPGLYVLSIPHHGGRDLPAGTRRSILDQLEDDVLAWEEVLGDDDSNQQEDGTEES